jgi:RHS repeat-associated protein
MGHVQFLLDGNGDVLDKYTYDAFGKPKITGADGAERPTTSNGNRFLFTGREYLSALGLYDYRHRVYHPGLGRFMQVDPMGLHIEGAKLSAQQTALYPAGTAPKTFNSSELNLYRYCHNDPVNNIDPDGLVDLSYTPSTPAFAVFHHWEGTYNPSNTFTVAGHADPHGIKNASGAYVSMKRIVDDIVKNNTENKPIELVACQTGRQGGVSLRISANLLDLMAEAQAESTDASQSASRVPRKEGRKAGRGQS